MKKFLIGLLVSLFCAAAWANPPAVPPGAPGVQQSGTWTVGHCPQISANNLLIDSGAACGGSGSTPVIFVGASTNSGNAYTVATTTPSGFAQTNQFVVRATISATNTGPATLVVSGTTAQAIKKQLSGGFVALSGGELAVGAEYDFTFNSTCTCYVVTNAVLSSVLQQAASYTVTALDWAAGNYFNVTAASVTFTLPVSTSLAGNGGVIINAIANGATLTPNSADSINNGTVGASKTIPAGTFAIVTTDGAGHIYAAVAGPNACTQSVSGTTAIVSPSNCTQYNITITSGAATTLTINNGAVDGQKLMLRVANGSYSTTFDGSVVFGTDVTSYTSTASKIDLVGLQWDATKTKWLFLAVNHGF